MLQNCRCNYDLLYINEWKVFSMENISNIYTLYLFSLPENGVGASKISDKAETNNRISPHNNKSEASNHTPTAHNGKEENYMCFECAEEFDTKAELEEHVKSHKVYIKTESTSPNQNSALKSNEQSNKSESPNSLPYSPIPTKFSTPPPRSFSPYEDYIKMNANKSMDFNSSLSNYLNSADDSGGSYFDQYMRARGLDSPSFGQRYSRSPTPSRVQSANPLLITVTSGTVDGSDMKFICPVCGKSYLDKDSLSRHYETHSHFPCNVCGKTYSTKSNLHTHMKKHSDDKTYSCNTCDKTFTSPSVLKTHLRTHTGEKPFICPTCGVAFAKNIHLKRHLSIHTGIKPHECKVCNKRFSRSDHLKRHVQSIHTQDRPHICSLCGKDFVRKYELNKHMKQSHWGFTVGEEEQEVDSSACEPMDTSMMSRMHAGMTKGFVPFSESKADRSVGEENSNSPNQKGQISPDGIPITVKEEPISPTK